ncbi:MAG: hypothetical protein KGH69_03535 [Candidatus Micrarchaeota archaeon]|nr:hypothetical protein [Candidatus Micrarchaeota archaeon]
MVLESVKSKAQEPYLRKGSGSVGTECETLLVRQNRNSGAIVAPPIRENDRIFLEMQRLSRSAADIGEPYHLHATEESAYFGASEILTDMGHQIEKVNEKAGTISEAVENAVLSRRLVSQAAENLGLVHIAPGLLPFNAPNAKAIVGKTRYHMLAGLYNPDIYLMCINGSFQVHVKVGVDEAMDFLNVSQAASVAEYAWFANSPLLRGRETDYHTYRGMTWHMLIANDVDRRELDRGRVGITGPYENWDSWTADLIGRSFLFTKRLTDKGVYRYLSIVGLPGTSNPGPYGVVTFKDYMEKGSAVAYDPLTKRTETIKFADIDLTMHMHTWWTESRLTGHGTIEDRSPDNSGKTVHIAAAIAFQKGLYHNLKEASEFADSFTIDELNRAAYMVKKHGFRHNGSDIAITNKKGETMTIQQFCGRWIEIAERGLALVGETRPWLDPVKQMTDDKRNDADVIIELWRNKDLSERQRNDRLLEIYRVDA